MSYSLFFPGFSNITPAPRLPQAELPDYLVQGQMGTLTICFPFMAWLYLPRPGRPGKEKAKVLLFSGSAAKTAAGQGTHAG